MLRILNYIDCCVVLQNLLIDLGTDGDLENRWMDEEDISDVDDCTCAPSSYEILYMPVVKGSMKDERQKAPTKIF